MRIVTGLLCVFTLVVPAAAQTIDPDLEFLAFDRDQDDRFGISVSISGTTAIIGADGDDDAANESGSAYLFDTATGQQLFKLTASDAAQADGFGFSVSISGTTAIVGSSGSAYLFDTTTGEQLFKLTPSDGGPNPSFGRAVAISGTTAIVGALASNGTGAAYLFDTTTGQQLFKLTASDGGAGDEFGRSVAISGNIAICGAAGNDTIFDEGAAYLFDTTTGQQLFKLTASDADFFDFFGESVAISGAFAIVGNPQNSAAYLFDTTTGQELFKLTPSDPGSVGGFGTSVAVSDTTAFVRAALGTGSGVYLFDTTTGQQISKLAAPTDTTGDLGASLAISGTTAIIGASRANALTGSAYVAFLLQVTSQPQSVIANAGETALFSVALQEPSGALYQWRRNGADLTDSANITGSETATLEIVTASNMQGTYDCVVTNPYGSVITSGAVLAVASSTCTGDVNGDGVINSDDLGLLLNAFGQACN